MNVHDVFIPIKNIFETHNFVDAFGVALVYFIVITGLLGYHKSITKRPHLPKLGLFRYFLDLLILFLVYYMVSTANPHTNEYYGAIFLWVIPSMVLCYLFWDLVKYLEYKREKKGIKVPFERMKESAVLVLISTIFTISYYFIDSYYSGLLEVWHHKTYLDFIFMIMYFVLFFGYRMAKERTESIQS